MTTADLTAKLTLLFSEDDRVTVGTNEDGDTTVKVPSHRRPFVFRVHDGTLLLLGDSDYFEFPSKYGPVAAAYIIVNTAL